VALSSLALTCSMGTKCSSEDILELMSAARHDRSTGSHAIPSVFGTRLSTCMYDRRHIAMDVSATFLDLHALSS
jgi:hypothetical protein